MSRPQSQHRTSSNAVSSANLPIRHSTSRNHSHTVSLGTNNSSHRVTRRKSMTSGVTNNAAILRAAMDGSAENLPALPGQMNRRSLPVKHAGSSRVGQAIPLDDSRVTGDEDVFMDNPAYDNDGYDASATAHQIRAAESLLPPGQGAVGSKQRVRRASEGSHLSKGERKRASGELRCEKCGKGYKHSSCLTKHLSVSTLHRLESRASSTFNAARFSSPSYAIKLLAWIRIGGERRHWILC